MDGIADYCKEKYEKYYINNSNDWEGFLSIGENKDFGDVEIEVYVSARIRSGYYEAATLDWDLEVIVDGNNVNIEDLRESFLYYTDMNKGLAVIQSKNAESWAENIKDELIEIIESIFKQFSDEYSLAYRFSNGETGYSKIV